MAKVDISCPSLEEIQHLLSTLPQDLGPIHPTPALPNSFTSLIDHTLLAPYAVPADIVQCCQDAVELKTATVCVNSSLVGTAAGALKGSKVRAICTIGFPFGAGNTHSKVEETRTAVADGAEEIDMVQNVGLLKAGKYGEVFADISSVVQAAMPAKVKVILETCYLTQEEIAISTFLASRAGVAFVKTSTGYGSGGAKAEEVRLMYEVAHPYGVQVKASGGIRTADKVQEMVSHGASRIGASGTRSIVAELDGAKATSTNTGAMGY